MTKKRYFDFLDVIAVFAVIRVVFIHALNNYQIVITGGPVPFHAAPLWQQICDLLLRHSVPVFVLISGFKYALARQNHPDETYGEYLRKRSLRLLRPYLLWTAIVYIGVPLTIRSIPSHDAYLNFPEISLKTLWSILNGSLNPAYQLWFVPMLFLVIIIYPLIHRHTKWWISQPVLWSVFLIVRLNHLQIPLSYPAYLAFFDLGVRMAESKKLNFNLQKVYLPLGLATATIFICAACNRLGFIGAPSYPWSKIIQELSSSLSIFLLFGAIFHSGAPRWIVCFRHYVWPVFIMHEPFILGKIAWRIYIVWGSQSPVMYPVTSIIVLVISGITYFVMTKVKIHRYLF